MASKRSSVAHRVRALRSVNGSCDNLSFVRVIVFIRLRRGKLSRKLRPLFLFLLPHRLRPKSIRGKL